MTTTKLVLEILQHITNISHKLDLCSFKFHNLRHVNIKRSPHSNMKWVWLVIGLTLSVVSFTGKVRGNPQSLSLEILYYLIHL